MTIWEALTTGRLNFRRITTEGPNVSLSAGWPVTAILVEGTGPNKPDFEIWHLNADFNGETLDLYVEGGQIVLGEPVGSFNE